MEEGPISIKAWLHQRTRWIKGFIQVFCVYLKSITPNDIISDPKSHFTIFTFIGFTTYGLAIPPWLLLSSIKYDSIFLSHIILINLTFTLSYMYSVVFIVIKKNRKSISYFTTQDYWAILLWPTYFLLHIISCYSAIFEFIVSPFKWNKTEHAVSK